jgi:hypothetical protein
MVPLIINWVMSQGDIRKEHNPLSFIHKRDLHFSQRRSPFSLKARVNTSSAGPAHRVHLPNLRPSHRGSDSDCQWYTLVSMSLCQVHYFFLVINWRKTDEVRHMLISKSNKVVWGYTCLYNHILISTCERTFP